MDPVERIEPAGDTTVALMEAVQAAGHELWVTELRHLEAEVHPVAAARRISVVPWFEVADAERVPVRDFAAVFIRTDPPFDDRYLWGMHLLDLVDRRRTLFVNDPDGIRRANEKLYALRFPGLVPPTLISANLETIAAFVDTHVRAVLKPMDGFQGRGALLVTRGDPSLRSLVELQTCRGQRQVVAQEYLSAALQGNHRIFMADGEPLANVNRPVADGDFRTGDVTEVVELSADERRLCSEIGPILVRDGLRFVGLDVMGGRLIEINVTSPGGIRQLDRLTGDSFAPRIVDRLLSGVGTRLGLAS